MSVTVARDTELVVILYGYNHFGLGWLYLMYGKFHKHKTNLSLDITNEVFLNNRNLDQAMDFLKYLFCFIKPPSTHLRAWILNFFYFIVPAILSQRLSHSIS